jgi:hypothetical protein
MATSNTNSAASSDSVFPQLPSDVQNDIQTNISTFTDIVNQYRSGYAAASNDLPLATVVDLVNAAYGSNSPFLNGNASEFSGNNTVAGSDIVSSGSSLMTGSSSVFPVRSFPWDGSFGASPSEVFKLVEAEISSSYNLGDQNFGVGSQLPQSPSDVLQLLHSDITTFSKAIDPLQSGNNPLASTSTLIV